MGGRGERFRVSLTHRQLDMSPGYWVSRARRGTENQQVLGLFPSLLLPRFQGYLSVSGKEALSMLAGRFCRALSTC